MNRLQENTMDVTKAGGDDGNTPFFVCVKVTHFGFFFLLASVFD